MIAARQCNRARNRLHRGGFTLVEVMIASSLGVIAVAMAMTTFLSLSYAASGSIAYAEMNRNLRHAMNIMNRDLLPANRIISYNQNSFIFFSRKTPAGDVNSFFYKMGDRIMRWEPGSYRAVARGVDSIAITLYDRNGDATTIPASAHSVEIALRSVSTVVRNRYEDQARTRILLRNIE